MRRKRFWIPIGVIAVIAIVAVIQSRKPESAKQSHASSSDPVSESRSATKAPMNMDSRQVPAHYEVPPALADLRPVLPAAQFVGKAREAYEAVKQIPATIAQMPCYCHCDRGMGHKSLHSCFEDDHAAHCAVCTNEALMAYRLQKEGLSPKQIRERISEQFSEQ